MDPFMTALVTSVLGTVRVLVVLLVGVLASKWPSEPLLTQETCRAFSKVCAHLFLPALVVTSTGATLTPTTLRDSWQLVVAGSLTIAVSAVCAWGARRLFFRRPEDRQAFHPVGLAITFANSAGFPLLLMEALCEQENVRSDFAGDAVECFTQATGMIFLYVVVWQVYFFGWGFFALGHHDALERKLTGQPPNPRTLSGSGGGIVPHTESRPAMLQQAELGISTSSPKQERTVLGNDGIVAVDIGTCTGEINSGIMVGSPDAEQHDDRHGNGRWVKFRQRTLRLLMSPNIIAVTIGVAIAMVAPLQRMLFADPRAILRPIGAALQTVGQPEVAVTTLVMAGSLVQVPSVAAASASSASASISAQGGPGNIGLLQGSRRFKIKAGFLHVVCRLIVVPAVGFTLFLMARAQTAAMGENRLMHLVLLIEFAMPSASFVIVSLNQLRMPATAGFMARLYLWQYGASMITITAWVALAVHLVY